MLSPQAAQGLGDKGQLSPSSPVSAEGALGQGWGRGSARRRVSVKRSREGEPTWAAAGPDGARSLALIKGRVAAIVGGPGLRGHLLRLPVGKETAWDPGLAGVGRAGQGEERLDPPSSASHHVSCHPSPSICPRSSRHRQLSQQAVRRALRLQLGCQLSLSERERAYLKPHSGVTEDPRVESPNSAQGFSRHTTETPPPPREGTLTSLSDPQPPASRAWPSSEVGIMSPLSSQAGRWR